MSGNLNNDITMVVDLLSCTTSRCEPNLLLNLRSHGASLHRCEVFHPPELIKPFLAFLPPCWVLFEFIDQLIQRVQKVVNQLAGVHLEIEASSSSLHWEEREMSFPVFRLSTIVRKPDHLDLLGPCVRVAGVEG